MRLYFPFCSENFITAKKIHFTFDDEKLKQVTAITNVTTYYNQKNSKKSDFVKNWVNGDSLTIEKGEVVDLFCPVCHDSLNIPNKDALAKYIRIDDGLKESYIIISRKYGERITFKVSEDKHIETFGEKLSRFIDPDWFLEY